MIGRFAKTGVAMPIVAWDLDKKTPKGVPDCLKKPFGIFYSPNLAYADDDPL